MLYHNFGLCRVVDLRLLRACVLLLDDGLHEVHKHFRPWIVIIRPMKLWLSSEFMLERLGPGHHNLGPRRPKSGIGRSALSRHAGGTDLHLGDPLGSEDSSTVWRVRSFYCSASHGRSAASEPDRMRRVNLHRGSRHHLGRPHARSAPPSLPHAAPPSPPLRRRAAAPPSPPPTRAPGSGEARGRVARLGRGTPARCARLRARARALGRVPSHNRGVAP